MGKTLRIRCPESSETDFSSAFNFSDISNIFNFPIHIINDEEELKVHDDIDADIGVVIERLGWLRAVSL